MSTGIVLGAWKISSKQVGFTLVGAWGLYLLGLDLSILSSHPIYFAAVLILVGLGAGVLPVRELSSWRFAAIIAAALMLGLYVLRVSYLADQLEGSGLANGLSSALVRFYTESWKLAGAPTSVAGLRLIYNEILMPIVQLAVLALALVARPLAQPA